MSHRNPSRCGDTEPQWLASLYACGLGRDGQPLTPLAIQLHQRPLDLLARKPNCIPIHHHRMSAIHS